MNVLVLSKRQYTGKDLLDDRYGRLREIPLALAARGHRVQGVCLSYRRRDEGQRADTVGDASVDWHSFNARRLVPLLPGNYWRMLDSIARHLQPDVVWACSDAFHIVAGRHLARRLGVPLAVDLYDNFESFAATRLPGVRLAFRTAVREAALVTCVSRPLAELVRVTPGCRGRIAVIENATDPLLFRVREQAACRAALGLPQDALLIGTAGALSASRDIGLLFDAFARLADEQPRLHLVLAGPRDAGLALPSGAHVHDLGQLPLERVALLFAALDVAVVCNRDSAFGRYCFPQKLQEILACGVPVVAAAVGAVEDVLRGEPRSLYAPGDLAGLVTALRGQLANPAACAVAVPSWRDMAARLDELLAGLSPGSLSGCVE